MNDDVKEPLPPAKTNWKIVYGLVIFWLAAVIFTMYLFTSYTA